MDPYGIKKARGEEPYEQIGKNGFVRSPDDIKSYWDAAHVIEGAVREFADGRGVLDVRTVAMFAHAAMEAGIKSRRTRREP